MSLAGSIAAPRAVTATSAAGLAVKVYDNWDAAESRWARLSDGPETLPFQRPAWLRAWYKHHAGPGCGPVVMIVSDAQSGMDLLGLPLVRLRAGGLDTVTFADGGLTDYNAPALSTAILDSVPAATLWHAVRGALPRADRLFVPKMPVRIDERANPLVGFPGVRASRLTGNILHMPDTWDGWLKSLERTSRKELGRSARVFDREQGAEFRRYGPGPEAARVYRDLEALQQARIAELGLPYQLGTEPSQSFYRTVVEDGLRDGTAVLTALTAGGETVAALLGITDGHHYAMTRLATPGPQWKHVSPGRLVITRTLQMLHAEGFRTFDFTIGEYPYKRRLGVSSLPMVELDHALSWRGLPVSAFARLRAEAAQRPALRALAQKLRGPRPSRTTPDSGPC